MISDLSLIVPIVKALNRKQWFSGAPSLSVNYLTLEIFKENGTRTKFLLKYHKQDQSLVLNFVEGPNQSFFTGGYALCPDLMNAFSNAGVSLEREFKEN